MRGFDYLDMNNSNEAQEYLIRVSSAEDFEEQNLQIPKHLL